MEKETGIFDEITSQGVTEYLSDDLKNIFRICVVDETESTNNDAKKYASDGVEEGFVLIANRQKNGKGRMGRSFFSPEDTGIYMSLVLKPEISPEKAVFITTAAAVSVCKALEKVGAEKPQIKWVNDVFVNGKKVCGILTEAGINPENKKLDYAVLGVGVNMYSPKGDFPADLRDIAGGALTEAKENLRNRFIAYFLESFMEFYKNISSGKHISEYRDRCFVLGSDINIISHERITPAKALEIDENCCLVAELSDGERVVLNSGEISIRRV